MDPKIKQDIKLYAKIIAIGALAVYTLLFIMFTFVNDPIDKNVHDGVSFVETEDKVPDYFPTEQLGSGDIIYNNRTKIIKAPNGESFNIIETQRMCIELEGEVTYNPNTKQLFVWTGSMLPGGVYKAERVPNVLCFNCEKEIQATDSFCPDLYLRDGISRFLCWDCYVIQMEPGVNYEVKKREKICDEGKDRSITLEMRPEVTYEMEQNEDN